jgi:hypothetical protein
VKKALAVKELDAKACLLEVRKLNTGLPIGIPLGEAPVKKKEQHEPLL